MVEVRGALATSLETSGLLLAALLLAGCGDDVAPRPDLPTETPALWNPCDALDAAFIERQFGTVATEEAGEPTAPVCRFVPEERTGQPVIEANYLQFSGGLDQAWDTMGQPEDADVDDPVIAGADAARVVVDVVKKQLYVTGFVQNGDLIQSVNVIAPAPYDQKGVVTGVEQVLTRLSAHADRAGVGA
ncbi:hypothetical protein HNR19_000016 [Nocardioides thalensis]|uniref:DUF3558 domain-containing protein n=1 Tax=Nocardioides thalensis TaxID=1914755 RepID=A0A853BXZ1_9ACTN|nr:hypothetical protein [Nocardioides thalensis]NYI99317.1 hypothetical protein [Nocardioides thalensis]